MNCQTCRNDIEESEMSGRLSYAAQAHVEVCPACRYFQDERLSLRQLIGSLDAVSAPADFDFRLRARLAAIKSASGKASTRSRFAPGMKAISVAAACVLLMGTVVLFKQFQAGPGLVPSSTETYRAPTGPASVRTPEVNSITAATVNPAEVDKATASPDGSNAQMGNNISQPVKDSSRFDGSKVRRNSRPFNLARPPVFSNDLVILGNPPVMRPVQSPPANVTEPPLAGMPLHVSSQPIKILLRDRQGTKRSISFAPVIFGSQDFLKRNAQHPSLKPETESIW